ncbi:MAG: beta-CASP ribonuclease aCPSF1 [Thaumarchaeota archaeon]|nr:beta-CASP ribonuclease aCPSF1 [Candidatus Terraquivivens yellowstonensis]MCL7395192.1 beta-CASP ribonuclease aCPSF1 [Candidatus Terraquivivens yellowstonensis]MCL7398049.1 beta-CASP ribonuclease aCPSF1 [Candidatus Terraquivivens yellowstonensis]MCL7398689.1 beta-CASP ribonuclease aCPSF1 [Candidatus Terraquivivens yellowstonensis]MCL7400211.1 beta-CASP ribonuclease aCPSF1 [Candidatus Terraquivivens yellowstonensis]
MSAADRLRAEILRYFSVVSPREAAITRIEYEGTRLAIYTRNPELFVERDQIAKDLVNILKKRVVIRSDPTIRLPQEEAEKVLKSIFGDDATVFFDETLGEAIVEVKNPNVNKNGETIKNACKATGWHVKLVRKMLMPSKTIEKINQYIYKDSDKRLSILRTIGERVFGSQTFETSDITLTILGSGRQVGRSAILLQTNESKILLDCGVAVGSTNKLDMLPRFDAYPSIFDELDAVIATHAHLDHTGAIPYLFKYGYKGPVYCSEPTLPLMTMEQLDFINVAEKEGLFPLYNENDVKTAVQHTITLKYGSVTSITPDVRITMYNAGHILGSSVVHIHIGEGLYNIVYTSDFKFENTRTLDACAHKFLRAETLMMESTYGATPIPFTREESEALLADYIKQTIEAGGKVLIPVPAVGRAQEIMLVLNDLLNSKSIPEVPIYLDGLVIEATAIYTAFPEYLSKELQDMMESQGNVFMSDYFTPVKSHSQREEVLNTEGPAIVISTSGMLEGGPVLNYLKEFANDEKNMLIFVSYQVEGTLGRKLLKGIREVSFIDEKGKAEVLNVKLRIEKVDGFSGHSSRQQLLNYLKKFTPKPKNVILLHGEVKAIESLAESASKIITANIYTPKNLETISLFS